MDLYALIDGYKTKDLIPGNRITALGQTIVYGIHVLADQQYVALTLATFSHLFLK